MDSANYLTQCNKVIQNFIVNSTRKETGELTTVPIESFDFSYEVFLKAHLSIDVLDTEVKGCSNTGLVFSQKYKYEEALKLHSARALERTESLQEVYQFILNNAYGSLNSKQLVHEYPTQILYTYHCHACHGEGKINCDNCNGSGKKTCNYCYGDRQILKQRTRYDSFTKQDRQEKYYEDCLDCNSSGKVNCSYCEGSGVKTCSTCIGTGYLTTISAIQTVVIPTYSLTFYEDDTPKYIVEALYKADLAKLAQYGEVSLKEHAINPEQKLVNFSYKASTPFARLKSSLDDKEVNWILYGTQPCIFDAGHVLEILLKQDLDWLVQKSKTLKLFNPFVGIFSKKVIKNFMLSEAHQAMLDGNSKNIKGNDLREHLNRSFTTTYIAEALVSLKSLTNAIRYWSAIKWFIFSIVISYLYIVITCVDNYRYSAKLLLKNEVLLSSYSIYETKFSASIAYNLFTTYAIKAIPIMLVIAFISSFWLKSWFKRTGTYSLLNWGKHYKLIMNRWIVFTLLGTVTLCSLLYYVPVAVDSNNNVLGVISVEKILSFSQWIKETYISVISKFK